MIGSPDRHNAPMSAVAKLFVTIPRLTWGHLFEGTARPPTVVWAPALAVAALLLLAPVYLALRTVGAGEDAVDLIFRTRTLWVVARTVALMVAVMAVSYTHLTLPTKRIV